jgi:hypothetical protein
MQNRGRSSATRYFLYKLCSAASFLIHNANSNVNQIDRLICKIVSTNVMSSHFILSLQYLFTPSTAWLGLYGILHMHHLLKQLIPILGVGADANPMDQSKRLRTGGDYTHSPYAPPPFHPPPPAVSMWGTAG